MSKQPVCIQALAGIGIGCAVLLAFGQIVAKVFSSPFLAGTIDQPAHARLVADRTQCDFGRVPAGRVMEAAFEIRNTGGRRLILRKANGDCDCLSTREPAVIVEPGGHRTIIAKLDTNKEVGSVKIGVHYRTNDPRHPRLTLFCLANVVGP